MRLNGASRPAHFWIAADKIKRSVDNQKEQWRSNSSSDQTIKRRNKAKHKIKVAINFRVDGRCDLEIELEYYTNQNR